LREVARTHEELAGIGLKQQYIVINGILPKAEAENDNLALQSITVSRPLSCHSKILKSLLQYNVVL